MYLRAAKTEAEEAGESTEGMANSVSELREEILDLTGQQVDIQIDDDTFKSTYQILAELSKVWDDLTDVSQANLLELVGGKRNANVVSALLENFSVAEEALKSSMAAAGSAVAENEKHLDSIRGKLAEFKAQFESLSTTFIESGFIKGVVEFGTFLLQMLEGVGNIINALGGLNTVLTVTLGLLAIIKAESIAGVLGKTSNAILSIIPNIITLVSKFKDFGMAIQLAGIKYSGLEQVSKALNAIGISASTAQVAMIGFIAAAAGIYIAVKAVDYFNVTVTEAKESLEDLSADMNSIKEEIGGVSSKFSSLKKSSDEIIPRFAELASGVNEFGENISLTDEEYDEFINLNNRLAEMFPQINSGMDVNGNAMLNLSLSSDTLTDSLKKLVEAEREAANIEIANKLPDVLDNLKESDKNFEVLIKDAENRKSELVEAYKLLRDSSGYTQTISQGSDEIINWSYDSILKKMGVNVSHDIIKQDGQTITYGSNLEFDMSVVGENFANELTILNKEVELLTREAASKWKDINPVVSAWMQTDYYYNELNDGMQFIVDTIASGLDFSSIDGLNTSEDITNYISDNIIKPLVSADANVQTAFESIETWKQLLQDGVLTQEQFSSNVTNAFDMLFAGMPAQQAESLKKMFVTSFNAIGIAGEDFTTVLHGMIAEWSKAPTAAELAAKSFADVKDKLTSLSSEISAVNSAISEQGENGSLTLETYEALIAASDDYASCIEYENGYLQLNTEKARELLDAKTELQILELEQAKIQEADNYREIAEAIANADDADEEFIATKQAELDISEQLINKYRVMQSELAETLSAYNKWKDAQDDPESGDMYDDTLKALEQIKEGLESGKVGTAKYKASVELLVPEANREDVSAYIESLERYIAEDVAGVSNFISDAITAGLMVDDGAGNISIVSDTTVKDFCDKLTITPSMAQAIFGELREYDWDFDWEPSDFISAVDAMHVPVEVDMDELFALQTQLSEYRAQLAAMKQDPLVLQADITDIETKIAITEQAIIDSGGVVPVDTTDAQGNLQAVQENLDSIAKKADTVAAKVIGDLGASTTIISLQGILNKLIEIDNKTIADKHSYVYVHTIEDGSGESSASGTDSAKGGRTLVGELGPELVVSGSQYYLVGEHGAEFVNLKAGDMVFNHVDTQRILAGKSGVRGQALWMGVRDADLLGAVVAEISNNTVSSSKISGGGKWPSISSVSGSSSSGNSSNSSSSRGSYSNYGSSSGSSSSKKDDEESWFERQYKDHQHWLEMDKENVSEYLDWLDDAYQKAYNEGIIELDDYYKYQEEVCKGVQDLFKDHLSDIDHEISLLESGVGNSDEIIDLSLKAIEAIEKEIDAAYAAGLDNNGDYIQYLENQWSEYTQTIIDLREDAEAESESTINDLVEYRIKMLKAEIEAEKDALDQKLSDIKDFYDKQREMLQDQADEEKYLEEQTEKRKSVTDIRAELAMLERDNSAWAQKRKMELQAELADAEKELNSFEKDHALDVTLDMLDEQQTAQEAQIQAQIDVLDKKLNDPHALFNQALEDIKNNTAELYQEFIAYNRKYGSGNDKDIADMWEGAYKADLDYQETHGGAHLDGIAIGNYTGYTPPANIAPPEGTYPTKPDNTAEESNPPSLEVGSTVQVKKSATHFGPSNGRVSMASFVPGGTYTVYGTNSNEVLIGQNGVYTGWVNKSDIVGYKHGTNYSVSGLAEFDEDGKGSEYIFESSDGNRYRMFGEGSKVLNSDATQFLYDFATSGGGVLKKMLTTLFGLNNLGNIAKPIQAIELNAGDIIIQGNASERTVSEIRRAQRESLKFVMTELNKLNK